MKCVRPIPLRFNPKSPHPKIQMAYLKYRGENIKVPCGKCVACRIEKAKEWSLRCMFEMENWSYHSFLTLTYDDEHLPDGQNLVVKDLQDFNKRLRKNYGNKYDGFKMRYFACGEYGEENGRPHYHSIVFSNIELKDDVKDIWGKGNIYIGGVTYQSINYVARYVNQKYASNTQFEFDRSVRPFQLASLGMGLWFAAKIQFSMIEDNYVRCNGKYIGIPQYFVKKLNFDKSKLQELGKDKALEELLSLYNYKAEIVSEWEVEKIRYERNLQNEMTLNKRFENFKDSRKIGRFKA